MTRADHDRRLLRRHPRAVIGVAGLTAVLGAGALLAAGHLTGDDTRRPVTAEAPRPVTAEQPAVAGPRPVHPARGAAAAGASPGPVADRLKNARSANARLGTEVRQPLPPKNGGYVADSSKIRVVESGSLRKDRKTMRVVSAPLDLTGQRELTWVADKGVAYRGAHCSQKIKLSNNVVAEVRPTLLICWRLSATRSAYTVLVDLGKKPSMAESVAAIDRAWARLR